MIAVPVSTPDTTPVNVPTAATAALLLVQNPPGILAESATLAPTHTLPGLVIVAMPGDGLTVITFDVADVPQKLVTV